MHVYHNIEVYIVYSIYGTKETLSAGTLFSYIIVSNIFQITCQNIWVSLCQKIRNGFPNDTLLVEALSKGLGYLYLHLPCISRVWMQPGWWGVACWGRPRSAGWDSPGSQMFHRPSSPLLLLYHWLGSFYCLHLRHLPWLDPVSSYPLAFQHLWR